MLLDTASPLFLKSSPLRRVSDMLCDISNRGVTMKSARRIATLALLVAVVYVFQTRAQQTQRTARTSDQDEQPTGGTMRPVIRGTHAAVSSMKPEATRCA